MRASEWVAFGYFLYLAAVAVVRLPPPRKRPAIRLSLASAAAVFIPLLLPETSGFQLVRDWMPALYLLGGYWLSGLFFVAPMPAVERTFLAFDRWLYNAGLDAVVTRTPRLVLELLEFAYLSCFIFVPGGALLLFLGGAAGEVDRYWTLVLASEYGAFGVLPWIQTRPPRAIESQTSIDRRPIAVRRLNRLVNSETSIGANTFPSGHVAGSLMTALAVSHVLPELTLPMIAVAALITASTVIGRYHYAVDAVAGALLTALLWWLA